MDKKGRKGKRKKKRRKKEGKQTGRGKKRNRIERREREMGERNKNVDFPGIPTVETRRFEKKSRSTHRELCVGTKILEFRQTPRGREFSYLDYF